MTIADFTNKIKSQKGGRGYIQDILIVLIVLGVGIGSFYLGKASTVQNEVSGISFIDKDQGEILPDTRGERIPIIKETVEGGAIVASKNGTKYYTAGCSASRIKKENIITFKTEQLAQVSGYTKSTTCK